MAPKTVPIAKVLWKQSTYFDDLLLGCYPVSICIVSKSTHIVRGQDLTRSVLSSDSLINQAHCSIQWSTVDLDTSCSSVWRKRRPLVAGSLFPISRALWENLIGASWQQGLPLCTRDQQSDGSSSHSFHHTVVSTWPAVSQLATDC